ncbi:MAG: hypothetical protein RLZZ502_1491 [Pseudomonadota bacterium]|jgi:XRE family aerobic/anaerobic benzoate catabolism transcriptional regulator
MTIRPIAPSSEQAEQAFLLALGERVKDLRIRSQFTRKQVAQSSGVSERYLAQLENGEGNISILLLRRVLQVFHLPMAKLLAEFDVVPQGNRPIALIGMRGAGKTTLGKALAKQLKRPFVEVDAEIEKLAGSSLAEIFAFSGPEGYASYEQKVLSQLLAHPSNIIATGGSVVHYPLIYQELRSRACVLWLKARPEDYMQRVIQQGDLRPMAGRPSAMVELRELLKVRDPLYALAELCLDTSKRTEKQCLAELLKLLG